MDSTQPATAAESASLRTTTLKESLRYCHHISRNSGSSFYLPFWLLPKKQFDAMCVIYAFFRWTDDLADDATESTEIKRQRLEQWRTNLDAVSAGNMTGSPINPGLKWAMDEFLINPVWLHDTILGVEQDLVQHEIITTEDFDQYCYRVAGTVGHCCLQIWGSHTPEMHELAVICGRAFQRTNILRDIFEDIHQQRCYVASAERAPYGLTTEILEQKQITPAFLAMMHEQIQLAQSDFIAAREIQHSLRGGGRKMFTGIYRIYYELLQRITHDPAQIAQRRITVPRGQKMWLTLKSLFWPYLS
jgi:phytoene synthase